MATTTLDPGTKSATSLKHYPNWRVIVLNDDHTAACQLRAERRPKLPSDKELALEALQFVDEKLKGHLPLLNYCNAIHTIRRALEALDD